ncbi:MAG: reverse transcriptase-like protein [Clostridiales bacterium]|nr:reverse transcriptase-like protein [Clostridiales bacterium]
MKKENYLSATAYTDGSYNKDTRNYGCGVVLLIDGQQPILMHATGKAKPGENGWQVNGEIEAALIAIRNAEALGCGSIQIFHDYEGVGKWPDGLWKTNKTYTRRYADEVRELRKRIKVTFTWGEGHAGNQYNEMADREAKIGAELI